MSHPATVSVPNQLKKTPTCGITSKTIPGKKTPILNKVRTLGLIFIRLTLAVRASFSSLALNTQTSAMLKVVANTNETTLIILPPYQLRLRPFAEAAEC